MRMLAYGESTDVCTHRKRGGGLNLDNNLFNGHQISHSSVFSAVRQVLPGEWTVGMVPLVCDHTFDC
jgi:hypothetical protein